jgi:hypothetical protein
LSRSAAFALLLAAATACAAPAARAQSDPKAIAVADQVMAALGGHDRWDRLVGLEWTFDVAIRDTVRSSRRHAWNKHTGWHRVSGMNRAGQPFVIIDQLDTGKGAAWVNGNRIDGDSLQKLIKLGKSLWTNDSYWFLMPYKMRDPGVTLKYEGETGESGRMMDKIAMSFDKVGETPGDHYWVSVDRGTHRVAQWEYVLQGDQPPPQTWAWDDWEEHGGLWFSTARHGSGPAVIYTRAIQTVSGFPDSTFAIP